jgi:hypothetical protein
MRIYFDNCCFSHPFDDSEQGVVIMEGDAVRKIINRCRDVEDWVFFSSDVLDEEIGQTPDISKLVQVVGLYQHASIHINGNNGIARRAAYFQQYNVKSGECRVRRCKCFPDNG